MTCRYAEKKRASSRHHRLLHIFLAIWTLLGLALSNSTPTQADAADTWWNETWPYRIPVTIPSTGPSTTLRAGSGQVSGTGVAEVSIDFAAAFDALGLNGALLDVRSLRVVPYDGTTPGAPLAHAETYSTMLEDADSPQIGWSGSGVYWSVNDGSAEPDATRFSQGSGSLKAVVENEAGGYGYPGVELHVAAGEPLTDWSAYDTFIYDVWPEVNASALDQSPDLYWFKLYDACDGGAITQGGPPLALGRWNYASVSLDPLHTCTASTLDAITRMEFHTRDNETVSGNGGLWDDGDQLTLWFDNLRLVDQDSGSIKWQTDGNATKYYVYFDTLAHEGHSQPTLADLGAATATGTAGAPEAGGYFHQIEGTSTGGLSVWAAPPVEKIPRTQTAPVAASPRRRCASTPRGTSSSRFN